MTYLANLNVGRLDAYGLVATTGSPPAAKSRPGPHQHHPFPTRACECNTEYAQRDFRPAGNYLVALNRMPTKAAKPIARESATSIGMLRVGIEANLNVSKVTMLLALSE